MTVESVDLENGVRLIRFSGQSATSINLGRIGYPQSNRSFSIHLSKDLLRYGRTAHFNYSHFMKYTYGEGIQRDPICTLGVEIFEKNHPQKLQIKIYLLMDQTFFLVYLKFVFELLKSRHFLTNYRFDLLG